VKELLERWSTVEPTRCRLAAYKPSGHSVFFSGNWWWTRRVSGGDDRAFLEHNIQAAIQEAITARRLHLELNLFEDGSAAVTLYRGFFEGQLVSSSDGGTVAEVLLNAYLRALEND
jgi:hypothetical protein